jgi:hypothetical protein
MRGSEPEPRSCWECSHRNILRLPDGGWYVDCDPVDWRWPSCLAKLLQAIENSRSIPRAMRREKLSEPDG